MKQIVLLGCLLAITAELPAQIINPKQTAKRKVEDRTNSRTDQGMDRGLDKIEEGLKGIFKKKDKKKKNKEKDETEAEMNENTSDAGNDASTAASANSFKTFSKFDFVPGEKIIAYEDFMQDAVGDFPAQWNTNAGGEIIAIDGAPGKWLKVPRKGVFFPDFLNAIPDNATVEFDMAIDMGQMSNNQSGLMVIFAKTQESRLKYDQVLTSETSVTVDIHPSGTEGYMSSHLLAINEKQEQIINNEMQEDSYWNVGEVNRISIWRQATRIRVYVNEKKIWDIPRAFIPGVEYGFLFGTYMWGDGLYISNLRVAAGQPDSRSALISKGRFSTTGILFEVNSDQLSPASYGILKDIATVLKENPTVQVQIVGHTDNDGDDKVNQSLSERRAKSVAAALSTEFGIDKNRMQTTGKGESDPVAANDTPQNKAQNRRVEFINLTTGR